MEDGGFAESTAERILASEEHEKRPETNINPGLSNETCQDLAAVSAKLKTCGLER